jgi:hypothetical protein
MSPDIDFFDFVDLESTAPEQTVTQVVTEVPAVVEKVTVTRVRDTSVGYLGKDDKDWAWDDLRDFVVHEIEARHGAQARDFRKESGIFKGFLSRYGVTDADGKVIDATTPVALARLAFSPVFDGMWRSAPIAVTRFTKGSDPYFGDVLLKRL